MMRMMGALACLFAAGFAPTFRALSVACAQQPAQPTPEPSAVVYDLTPKWKVGDSIRLGFDTRAAASAGGEGKPRTITVLVEATVSAADASGFVVTWMRTGVRIDGKDLPKEEAAAAGEAGALLTVPLKLELMPDCTIRGVGNQEDVLRLIEAAAESEAKRSRETDAALRERMKTMPPEERDAAAKVLAVAEQAREFTAWLRSNPEVAIGGVLQDAKQYFSGMGWRLEGAGDWRFEDRQPTPISDELIPSTVTLTLPVHDPQKGRAVLKTRRVFDKDVLGRIVLDLVRRQMREAGRENEAPATIAVEQMEEAEHEIDLATGWSTAGEMKTSRTIDGKRTERVLRWRREPAANETLP